jgi:hypothetical protein
MTPAEAGTGKTMREDLVQATVQPAALGGSVIGPWMPIETAPYRQDVLVAVMGASGEWVIGEAYLRDTDNDYVGAPLWWWANTGPGDYYSDDILSMSGRPLFWRSLPAAPGIDDRTESQRQNETDSLRLERDALLAALESIVEYWNGGFESAVDAAEEMRFRAQNALAALTASKATGERT